MTYTSPSPANVAYNGNFTTWWIPATNLGTLVATGVVVNVAVTPIYGLQFETWSATKGTFNPTTGVWQIGTLQPGETKWLKIVTKVADIGLAPYTMTSIISGTNIDPNNINNTKVQTVTSVVTCVTGGAVDDDNKCSCGNVSLNDIACNYGITEWRLNSASITNSSNYFWDTTTGKYRFQYDDITKDITATYSMWCDGGSGFIEVSGPATLTIPALMKDKTPFDHSLSNKKGVDLTAAEIATIKTQPEYSLLTDTQIQAYCWNTLLNGDGVLVGGWALDCNTKQDARTFFECSTIDCGVIPDPCPTVTQGDLPLDVYNIIATYADYEEEIGDTIYVKHPNAYSVYKWNGSQWAKWSCGCIFTISQDADNLLTLGTDNAPYLDPASLPAAIKVTGVDVTGTTTKTITITNSDGSTATNTFIDLDTDTTYILDGTTTPGTIFLRNAVTNAIISTVVLPIGSGQTYLDVNNTCSLLLTKVGDGSMANPYIISGEVLTGSPVPLYVSGTVAQGSSHTVPDVSVLFTESCGPGCTATYIVIGYPDAVFENVVLTGIVLTYDIKADAPGGGTHFIEIEKTCA